MLVEAARGRPRARCRRAARRRRGRRGACERALEPSRRARVDDSVRPRRAPTYIANERSSCASLGSRRSAPGRARRARRRAAARRRAERVGDDAADAPADEHARRRGAPSATAQPVGERVDGQRRVVAQKRLIVSSSSTLHRRARRAGARRAGPSRRRRGAPGWITQSSVAGIASQSALPGVLIHELAHERVVLRHVHQERVVAPRRGDLVVAHVGAERRAARAAMCTRVLGAEAPVACRRRRAGSAWPAARRSSRRTGRSSPSPATGRGRCAGRSARGRSRPGGRGSARPRSPSASVIGRVRRRARAVELALHPLLGEVGDVGHHARDVHRVVGRGSRARATLRERDVLRGQPRASRRPAPRARSRPGWSSAHCRICMPPSEPPTAACSRSIAERAQQRAVHRRRGRGR